MDTFISQEQAERLARSIRQDAARHFQNGALGSFARGQIQGQATIVYVYMEMPKWIKQGIENEIDYYCRSAIERGQK